MLYFYCVNDNDGIVCLGLRFVLRELRNNVYY